MCDGCSCVTLLLYSCIVLVALFELTNSESTLDPGIVIEATSVSPQSTFHMRFTTSNTILDSFFPSAAYNDLMITRERYCKGHYYYFMFSLWQAMCMYLLSYYELMNCIKCLWWEVQNFWFSPNWRTFPPNHLSSVLYFVVFHRVFRNEFVPTL